MNQILATPKSKSHFIFLKIELFFSILLLCCCLGYFLFSSFFHSNREDSSFQMLDNYRLLSLYSATNTSFQDTSLPFSSPFTLGTISIEKLRYLLSNYI